MTEKELRNQVVNTAKAWFGLKESNGSFKVIVDTYNSHQPLARGYKLQYNDAWCAGFVSAVAIKCGLTDIMPTEVGVPNMIDLYRKLGRWEENDAYIPEPGDVIMYSWSDNGIGDCTTGASHVGIVADVFGNTITVIEGNFNDAVGYRQIAINGKNIRGFGLPDYASKETKEPEKEEEEVAMRYNKVEELPVSLRKETQELIDCGVLKGINDQGDLDVTIDMIRAMIINKRYTDLVKNLSK